MNRTDTLLRLKRFRVDEMKRRIASIDAMKADLERKLADLDDNVAREKQRAGDSDIGRLAFPSFLRSIEQRRENLRTTLKEIEREYAAAQADMENAFQDLKSLEVATEQQAKRLAEMQNRRAQARLDEMALVRHLRKHALRASSGRLNQDRQEGAGENHDAHAAHDQRAPGQQRFDPAFPFHVPQRQRLLAFETQALADLGIGGNRKSFAPRGAHSNRRHIQ